MQKNSDASYQDINFSLSYEIWHPHFHKKIRRGVREIFSITLVNKTDDLPFINSNRWTTAVTGHQMLKQYIQKIELAIRE